MVDDDGRTALRHVYAGGDVTTGAATVILAMGAAKKAAHAIDRMIREESA
jgi:glutamate synthase (NADPH/NADH) small chain